MTHTLDELQKDALREIFNLALGQSASLLNDILNIYVYLNIPKIELLTPQAIPAFFDREIDKDKRLNIIEQYFIGKCKGIAYLVLPDDSSYALLQLIGDESLSNASDYPFEVLKNEALLEISNIIIGACVGKIAELIGDAVSFMPPRPLQSMQGYLPLHLFETDSYVIILKTIFHFEHRDIDGFLFLINSYESIRWLKQSVDNFIASYL